jgi:multicomponent Na+:H+ antiporter subunit G
MNLALDIFSIAAIGAGTLFFFAGTVGLLRFPDALTRLHALTKADNLGLRPRRARSAAAHGKPAPCSEADRHLDAYPIVRRNTAQLIGRALRRKGLAE